MTTNTAMPLQVMMGKNALDISDASGNPICVMVGKEADCQHIAHFMVDACNAHDDLVKALKRAQAWIEGAMEDKGWPTERVKNPPTGSHLDAINSALKKAGAA